MSNYGKAIRDWAEALLCDGAGTTRIITSGRFHRNDAAGDLEYHPASSAERAINIVLGFGHDIDGLNGLDGFVLREHPLTVRVSYVVTNAGDDGTEAATENSGPATLDAVQDRAMGDAHDISVVMQWYENYTGCSDPVIFAVNPNGDVSPPALHGDTAIMEVPFVVWVKATVPGKGSAIGGYAT